MIKFEKIGVQAIKQGELLMKIRLKKRKAFRLKVNNITLKGVIMSETVRQVRRVKYKVGIRILNSFIPVADLDLSGIDKECKKVKRPFKGRSVNLDVLIQPL
ncbi:hypothetical protein ACTJJ0_05650 [Chitinophaga sp. 22321]|uniref:Uncharacterized protein n=1 Tax=Chitinophaga hostae TaxID=2831022 RepID=A0ABS5IZI8_9BACT|nr:hypothetical protein [Chitinophaga hostae]MBS0028258.1 hypothetical protein [Chitinophaga hostae]